MGQQNKRKPLVALGVTGSIAAYKAAELLRRLQDRGLDIQPVMTRSAQQFITPYTLQTLAWRPTIIDLFDQSGDRFVKHISIAEELDLLLVAPATANIIAKFARGIADDFLSTLYLSTDSPVVIAPAMNTKMWQHPATRENIDILKTRGVQFVEPDSGYLAERQEGVGRLAEIQHIVDATLYALCENKSFENRKVLITAGPTAEDIDPMRFISNRSSGLMGIELAREARKRGAAVTLVCGPSSIEFPFDIESVSIRSADDMKRIVEERLDEFDILVMAAAVADYMPKEFAPGKIKKGKGDLKLDLKRTTDILSAIADKQNKPFIVGFAAESEELKKNAVAKLQLKKMNLIVANPISGKESVAGSLNAEGIIIGADGSQREIPKVTKAEMAEIIFDEIEKRLKP